MKDHLKIDSVFLEFRNRKILRGVSLNIEQNQVVGILGRNGSGKSCLLKIITGQLDPQFKYIGHNGSKIDNLYKKKNLINYLPQHEFHPKRIRIIKLIEYYGIELKPFLNWYPFIKNQLNQQFFDLSGGQKRLLEVLLVLESKSKYSILDEPFSHIMPIHIDLIKTTIRRIKRRKGILITDHQYRNILEISDKTFLLKDGQFQQVSNEKELGEKGYINN